MFMKFLSEIQLFCHFFIIVYICRDIQSVHEIIKRNSAILSLFIIAFICRDIQGVHEILKRNSTNL